ncbi:MAG: DUF29 domain-containing protein [Thainema sp.]
MVKGTEVNQFNLYHADYLKWIEATVEQLQRRDYASVDWENVIEEFKEMARRDRQALESNLVVVLTHLLKWQYQPQHRSGSWHGSTVEHRRRIRKLLRDSPSLKPYLTEVFAECYADAVEQTSAETELFADTFPESCPYSVVDVLDSRFLPS